MCALRAMDELDCFGLNQAVMRRITSGTGTARSAADADAHLGYLRAQINNGKPTK